jgi:hypothetical protein
MKTMNLRVVWIFLQGAFLPLVYFFGKYADTPLGWILFALYLALVFVDAILTCRIFEPKDKANGIRDTKEHHRGE